MSAPVKERVTDLLTNLRAGDAHAREELFRVVYAELRTLAAGLLEKERSGHTLQPTALVNEAAIRLLDNLHDLENRRHFFAAAAQAMRRVLVDHARGRAAQKRGAGKRKIDLTDIEALTCCQETPERLVILDDALARLAQISPRKAEAFVQSFYGGMDAKEIAEHLGVSPRAAQADLQAARAWLCQKLCA